MNNPLVQPDPGLYIWTIVDVSGPRGPAGEVRLAAAARGARRSGRRRSASRSTTCGRPSRTWSACTSSRAQILAQARTEAEAIVVGHPGRRQPVPRGAEAEGAGRGGRHRQERREADRARDRARPAADPPRGGGPVGDDRVEAAAAQRLEGRQRAADRRHVQADRSQPSVPASAIAGRRSHGTLAAPPAAPVLPGWRRSVACSSSPTPSAAWASPPSSTASAASAGAWCPSWRWRRALLRCARRPGGCACGPRRALPFGRRSRAFLAGDAIGSVTPLGLVASEPTKVLLARRQLATARRGGVARHRQPGLRRLGARAWWRWASSCCWPPCRCRSAWQEWRVAALVLIAGGAVVAQRLLRGTWSPERGAAPAVARAARRRAAVGAGLRRGHPDGCGGVFGLGMRVPRAGGARGVSDARVDAGRRRAHAGAVRSCSRRSTASSRSPSSSCRSASAWTRRCRARWRRCWRCRPAVRRDAGVVRKVRNLFWAASGWRLWPAGPRPSRRSATDRP